MTSAWTTASTGSPFSTTWPSSRAPSNELARIGTAPSLTPARNVTYASRQFGLRIRNGVPRSTPSERKPPAHRATRSESSAKVTTPRASRSATSAAPCATRRSTTSATMLKRGGAVRYPGGTFQGWRISASRVHLQHRQRSGHQQHASGELLLDHEPVDPGGVSQWELLGDRGLDAAAPHELDHVAELRT